jgi:acyl-CoA thioester hydrolase
MTITAAAEDIDELGHVNNAVWVRWIQDIAVAHWDAVAPAEHRAAMVWVVTRHEIDYRREAVFGDAVVARTWIGAVDSRRFERHTEIVRTSDDHVLARGRSLWTLISRDTGRVTRIPPDMVTLFSAYMHPA